MKVLYIVGAQCTGKTTLSKALVKHFSDDKSGLKCQLLGETARSTLKLHKYTREDIRRGGERCFSLQNLILQSQLEQEDRARQEEWDIVVSDRSGIDPLVFTHMYCEAPLGERLESSEGWTLLEPRLKESKVIVCEPVQEWLFDDGTRLIPLDWEEWMRMHQTFCQLLGEFEVPYAVLPASIRALNDRIDFVVQYMATTEEVSGNTSVLSIVRADEPNGQDDQTLKI